MDSMDLDVKPSFSQPAKDICHDCSRAPDTCVCNKARSPGMSTSSFKRRQNMTAPGNACNRCRARKIKCDTKDERKRFEEQNNVPWSACRQCLAAGQPCVISSSPSMSVATRKRRASTSQRIGPERSRGTRRFAATPPTPPLTVESLSPTSSPGLSTPPPASALAPSAHGEKVLRDLDCVCTLLSFAITDRQHSTP